MKKEIQYSDYLKLPQLLESQSLESEAQGSKAHEEMLFIVTHQAFELWFKQMLWELDSVIEILSSNEVKDRSMSLVVHRLSRVNEIWRLLIGQISVLETMTPLEFLEFRNLLYPASGFQSKQFRLIENKLGLNPEQRKLHSGCPYHQFLDEKEKPEVLKAEKDENLKDSIEKWLERTPYLKTKDYDFWTDYEESVNTMLLNEIKLIEESSLKEEDKTRSKESIEKTKNEFNDFMSKKSFNSDQWSFSFESLQAALFIQLYRHEPKLQLANRLIEELIQMDEHMTLWRTRHAQMAFRMLGEKVGTGGSSGAKYLKEATESHRVFKDFFRLTTYFIDGRRLKRPGHLVN